MYDDYPKTKPKGIFCLHFFSKILSNLFGNKNYNFKAIYFKNIKEFSREPYVPNLPEVLPRWRVLKTLINRSLFFVQVVANKIARTKPIKIIAPVFGKNFKFPSKKKKLKSTLLEGWSYADLSRMQQFTRLQKNKNCLGRSCSGDINLHELEIFYVRFSSKFQTQLDHNQTNTYHTQDIFVTIFFETSLINIGVVFFSRCSCWHFCAQSPGHLSKGCMRPNVRVDFFFRIHFKGFFI